MKNELSDESRSFLVGGKNFLLKTDELLIFIVML